MKFFQLDAAGDLNNRRLCLVSNPPEGMDLHEQRLALGKSAARNFPEDAVIRLSDDQPGIKLSGILGNLNNYLIVHRDAKEIIEALCADQKIEFFSFTLINHKGRVHSKDYFVVNPIGSLDCLNEPRSGVKYGPRNRIIGIKQFVLHPQKVSNAPHLFRVAQAPSRYVISEELLQALRERAITNLVVEPLQVSA